MTVLILTRSDDKSVERVLDSIRERGARAFRLDTDRFPTEIRLSIECGLAPPRMRMTTGNDHLVLSEVSAVWHRRLHVGGLLPDDMDKQLRGASQLESRATLMGMIASLQCFYLDPVPNIRQAQHKQLQLQVAQNLGLIIPKTLITNDPDEVRRFYRVCDGNVIAKMLSSFAVYEEGEERVVFTNAVAPEDLEELGTLRLCPMTFQERIPKALELRAVLIGDQVFTASIDSQQFEKSRLDWRRDAVSHLDAWRPYVLPDEIQVKLQRLLDFFGLQYGAFDLILQPDGRFVFLELNPTGEFFWLDRIVGLPISRAIADVLLGERRRAR
ncbi:MAG TPA: MvdD family ATP-grasp ribosomal peptide maturase [Myxococcaceae bacterium]|nr:MvdD family ATP-grasp ribosomal peptide maturase [Myxococcaceae bacterium]